MKETPTKMKINEADSVVGYFSQHLGAGPVLIIHDTNRVVVSVGGQSGECVALSVHPATAREIATAILRAVDLADEWVYRAASEREGDY
jgi:hypothetical protein